MAPKWYLAFVLMASLASCDTIDRERKQKDKYATSQKDISEIEKETPAKFLTVSVSDRKNLLGQTVVKGSITNNAKMVTYKDVQLKLMFFSKTKALLEQDVETIYDSVRPGASISFKSKYFAPKGSDSAAAEITAAKF